VWSNQPRNPLVLQPLSFWTTEVTKRQYPRLSRMATDIFTRPAMSDESERTFSSCSLMITSHRDSLKPAVVEATQCCKNWLRTGVIIPEDLIKTEEAETPDEDCMTVD
jgi:hypothetical protein